MVELSDRFVVRFERYNYLNRERENLQRKQKKSDRFKSIVYCRLIEKIERQIQMVLLELNLC